MTAQITEYHAHIYYDPSSTRDVAERLHEEAGRLFTVRLGRMHDQPVGPHPQAMFQIAFTPELFDKLVPWLMLNRRELTVLVHPETGRPRSDHLHHAFWMGYILPLKAEVLPETD